MPFNIQFTMKYIIEHLEERLYRWCVIEYENCSKIVGAENLIITNIPKASVGRLGRFAEVHTESISSLGLRRICVLDPKAKAALSPQDRFSFLVFGGILGDAPMRGRTQRELSKPLGAETRNLGKRQMPTDNAVYVAKHIADGGHLSELRFIDRPEFRTGRGEAVTLPFRFVEVQGKPMLSGRLLRLLKGDCF